MTFQELAEGISKLGWPALFVLGQMRGWWFVKPHIDFVLSKLQEVTQQLKEANDRADRAIAVAEGANRISQQAVDLVKEGNAVALVTADTVKKLEIEVSRLTRTGGN